MAWMTRKQVRSQPVQSHSEQQLQKLLDAFDRRMNRLNDDYLRRMGEHIRDIGTLWPSDVHRLQQIRRMNKNLRQLEKRIAAAAGMGADDIAALFERVAQDDARMAAKILGVPDTVNVMDNLPLRRILQAQARETANRMRNLSNTTVVSGYYRKVVDEACAAVQSGVEDYNTAIRRVIREAGAHGLRVREDGSRAVDYESGWSRRLDSAARMNVLDGMRHLNQSIMEEVGRQFGADGVEIDAHMLCAEDHLPYQGQQFSNEDFEQIQDSLQRPFGEWNCRHSWHPIMLGISPPAWTPEQLEEMRRFSTEPVTVDGRTKTRYKWSQEMRRIETAVRQQKDTANLARVTGDDTLRRRCQGNILELNRYYKELSEKVGLQPEFQKTYVAGFRDVNTKNDASKMSVFDQATENEKRIQWPPKGEPISAKEFKELKSYAAERGIALSGFRNSDVDTGLAREAIDALHRVATDFPKILGDEKHPLTISLTGFLNSNDFADKPLETSHIIRLNRDAFRDRTALKSEYEKLAQERHFVNGTSTSSVIYHEAGHMVADVYGIDANQLIRTITGSQSRIEALDKYRTQLSIYAGINEDESIAESFSAYYGLPGEKPQIVVDLFEHLV